VESKVEDLEGRVGRRGSVAEGGGVSLGGDGKGGSHCVFVFVVDVGSCGEEEE
jgi:hypothetical protein